MEETKKTLSRRGFLKAAGATAAVAGLATGGAALTPWSAEAAALPKKWDETFDVVVIGSGFAGLAAAYEAKKAGASVVVLEKMRTPGGNSIINGGVVAAAGSPLQEQQGIKDSSDVLFQDMLKAGLSLNHPELAKMVAEGSWPTVKWTIDELGVKYKGRVSQEGGHAVPRMYSTYNQSGSAIVQQQLAKLKELGVQPRMQSYLTQIYRDADGRVKGVQIREKYVFPKTDSGKLKTIRARKAVVLAAGGFGADISFRTIQDPPPTSRAQPRTRCGKPSASAARLSKCPGSSWRPGAARMKKASDSPPFSDRGARRYTASGSTRKPANASSTNWPTAKSAQTPSSGSATAASPFAMKTAPGCKKTPFPNSWKEASSKSTTPSKKWPKPTMSPSNR